MPSWSELEPFIVSGLALGGVYALSGVGLVVLYRATGVLYLAFGAVGALGALIAWSMVQGGSPGWLAWIVCILFGGVVTLGYGVVFGPPLAGRDPLVRAVATLGLTLILAGAMDLLWTTSGGQARSLALPTDNGGFSIAGVTVTWTEVIGVAAGVVLTVGTGAVPPVHQARHGDAGDGQRPGDHRDARRAGAPGRGGRLVRLRRPGRHRRAAAAGPGLARRHHAHLPGDLVAGRGADRAAALDRDHVRGGDGHRHDPRHADDRSRRCPTTAT